MYFVTNPSIPYITGNIIFKSKKTGKLEAWLWGKADLWKRLWNTWYGHAEHKAINKMNIWKGAVWLHSRRGQWWFKWGQCSTRDRSLIISLCHYLLPLIRSAPIGSEYAMRHLCKFWVKNPSLELVDQRRWRSSKAGAIDLELVDHIYCLSTMAALSPNRPWHVQLETQCILLKYWLSLSHLIIGIESSWWHILRWVGSSS